MFVIKNKGMFLESVINLTNQKYLESERCIVSKIPTNYVTGSINHNFQFTTNFNCDYIGAYQGRYFEFEAKQTSLKSFNLNNLRQNQIEKLNLVVNQKSWGFLIVYFEYYDRYFYVDWKLIQELLIKKQKTIQLEWFIKNGSELFINHQMILDYLSCLIF